MPEKYEVSQEGEEKILWVDHSKSPYVPSLEDSEICMAKTADILIESGQVTKIVLYQKRDYEYDFQQTSLLVEIALLYKKLYEKVLYRYHELVAEPNARTCLGNRPEEGQRLFTRVLKGDPIGCYVELRRLERTERIRASAAIDSRCQSCERKHIELIQYMIDKLDNTKLITIAKPYLAGYKKGDRSVYRRIFSPTVKPDFMYTKLMSTYPSDAEELDNYVIGDNTEITVFRLPNSVQYLYHMMPPEFKLEEDKYEILDLARKIMAEHKPERSEFVEPARMREVFLNVGRDLIEQIVEYKRYKLRSKEIDEIAQILVRYTVGFGLIEVLLQDEDVQDISVNSPMGQIPIYIVHGRWDDCLTNIMPTKTEAESWASKLRMISGRPLDEANPILDTELELPGASTRVSTITKPLDPSGLAFSFRRHRDKPWTLPLFIKVGMINPLASGLLSFLVDGTRSMLICGTRSSGKSSLLSGILIEIMRRYRIITVEDTLELPTVSMRKLGFNIQPMKVASALAKGSTEMSAADGIRSTLRLGDSSLIVGEVRSSLRGREEVVVVENGLTKRVQIKYLDGKNVQSFYLPTLDYGDKMTLQKLTGFIKHPKRKQLVKLTTKTGREVTVTPDHSVFTQVNFKIASIKTDQLQVGDSVIIPSKLPTGFNDIDHINLLDIDTFRENYRLENAEPYIRQAIKNVGWRKASKICEVADIYQYLLSTQKTRIPINHFLKLMKQAKICYTIEDLRIKKGTANSIPAKFPINENILRLIGYYLAEGSIDHTKIQITNSKPAIIQDIYEICRKELGLRISERKISGLGNSVQMYIISKPLMDLLMYLGCGRDSIYKRIPSFVYGLSERKICALLRGMYSGDGSFSSTKGAGNMIRYFSTCKKLVEDVSYALLSFGIVCRIHNRQPEGIGNRKVFIAEIKQRKYVESFLEKVGFTHKKPEVSQKSFSHSKDDSVCFDPKELEKHLKLPRKYRHLRRTKCCSKDYLARITEEMKCSDEIYDFAHGEFFIDKVKSIEVINLKKEEYVYDLSVKSTQRFVGGFGGILLHNSEAKALYEAMRVGAAANVVAGTIHGDSPYGIFDRVVNDIGVPKTSFKATDICVIANPVKSADGLHKYRRVTQITEVRKDWTDDPNTEGGFVDLMKYDAKVDSLVPSQELINGDSDILKLIAANIKEYAGNWDAVWENINLRARLKDTLVKVSEKIKDPDMLEAPFVIKSNDVFHNITGDISDEVGHMDAKMIEFRWNDWLKREIKRRQAGM